MAFYKQSVAYTRTFFMVASSDHLTAKTGASPVVNISKAGAAFGAAAGAVTEIANGWYKVALTTADTGTTGDLSFHITGTAADDTDFVDQIVSFDPFDSVRLGLTALPNAAAEAAGGLYTRGTGAGQINQQANGQIDSNVARWLNTAAATPATAGVPKVAIEAAGDFAQGAADKVWSTATRTLTSLGASLVQEIWDRATSALTTVGSIGKRLADFITGDAFVRLGAPAGASTAADIAAIKAQTQTINNDTDDIQTRLPAALVGGKMDSSIGALGAGSITSSTFAADAINANALAADAVDEIWDDALEGALTARQALRVILSANGGKSNSHESGTPKYRDQADSKNRISATTDGNGNRTAVTIDGT